MGQVGRVGQVGRDRAVTLVNARTLGVIADHVEIADTRRTRRRGLLGRTGLAPFSALVLEPCFAIHTAFMRFPIDAIFTARDGRVLRVVRDLPPWRIAAAPGAHAVIELAAGALGEETVAVGDLVMMELQERQNARMQEGGRDHAVTA
jgi:uncharacterized membrane protein (UPF0127 family)